MKQVPVTKVGYETEILKKLFTQIYTNYKVQKNETFY